MIKILFVCTGNICRSPLAHRLFERIIAEDGNAEQFEVDSCGTGAWHQGENADSRMIALAKTKGWTLEKWSRGYENNDINYFDYLIAMDKSHLYFLKSHARDNTNKNKIFMMREFDTSTTGAPDVPDPYYGGKAGFESVYDMIDRSCREFYRRLKTKHGL